MYAGKPMYLKIPSQSNGYFKLENDSALVSGGKSLEGNITVLGTGTPIFVARQLLKNFSSALHQNGLLITVVPQRAAFFKKAL
jgi:hypothetical protein